jgi:hypothetical protein
MISWRGSLSRWIVALAAVACTAAPAGAQDAPVYGSDIASDSLVEFNLADGTSTIIGPFGFATVTNIAFDTDRNILYGYDQNTFTLMTIDRTTGAGTVVGVLPMQFASNWLQSMIYDPSQGLFLGTVTNLGSDDFYGFQNAFITIDPLTAEMTVVREMLAGRIDALGFDGSGQLWGIRGATRVLFQIDNVTGAAQSQGMVSGGSFPQDYTAVLPNGNLLTYDTGGTDSLYETDVVAGTSTLLTAIDRDPTVDIAWNTACPDVDRDGYSSLPACDTPHDCDDGDPNVYPGAAEICDGANNDCLAADWPMVAFEESDADLDGFLGCDDDCNDDDPFVRPGAAEICNTIDDDCDTLVDEDELGEDTDNDGVHNACDNCRSGDNPLQEDGDDDLVGDICDNCELAYNPGQADFDDDTEGDRCDLNDGLIYITFGQPDLVEWQNEQGFDSWNSYKGDLAALRASCGAGTCVYTQDPVGSPLVRVDCGLAVTSSSDLDPLLAGEAAFFLTSGIDTGVESGIGTDSQGVPRPNDNPCP